MAKARAAADATTLIVVVVKNLVRCVETKGLIETRRGPNDHEPCVSHLLGPPFTMNPAHSARSGPWTASVLHSRKRDIHHEGRIGNSKSTRLCDEKIATRKRVSGLELPIWTRHFGERERA